MISHFAYVKDHGTFRDKVKSNIHLIKFKDLNGWNKQSTGYIDTRLEHRKEILWLPCTYLFAF